MRKARCLAGALLLSWLLSITAPSVASAQFAEPSGRVDGAQATVQLVVGSVGGIVGAIVGGKIGQSTGDGGSWGLDDIDNIFWGALPGWWIGSAAGVQLGGLVGTRRGSFPAVLVGSAVGTGAGLVLIAVTNSSNIDALAYLALAMLAIGGIAGFNVSANGRARRVGLDVVPLRGATGLGVRVALP